MYTALYIALATALSHFAVIVAVARVKRFRSLQRLARERNCQPIPYERPWDVLGVAKVVSAALHLIRGTSLADTTRLFKSLGSTYASKILLQPVVFTCHPRNIRHVLVTGFTDFDNSRGIRDHLFRPITAHGIFALDGDEWQSARGLYRNHFSNTRRIADMELFERCFQHLVAGIPENDDTCDLHPLLLRLTTDITTAFAMGEPVDALQNDQALDKHQFVESLMHVKEILARDGFLGPVYHFLDHRQFRIACRRVHEFVDAQIHRRSRERSRGIEAEKISMLDTLVEASDNVNDIRDGVITLLIAGIDSVATLLSTTFFLLARNKRVFDKLRASVLEKAGRDKPDFDTLRSLTYLRYVFNETMRVYPPVPFNARTANRDTYLPAGGGPDGEAGVLVAKGQRVVFSSWGSHRSLENFGEDAHNFRPERWEKLQAESLGFIPFNLGPRACPGQHFAMIQASYIATRLIQTFSHVESRDSRAWKEHLGLNLSNANGTKVAFKYDTEAIGSC
ncbi:putative cytochrome P450 oxidoreductase/alkane hydroxylase [Xylariaceae sp. FL1272]|nr:putative cytochrome P450 oxidoreductase/alkane hydroxylase [Xylariaceae sp. FL1272]